MEYTITFHPDRIEQDQVSYTLTLTDEQLGGVLLFLNLYSYDRWIDNEDKNKIFFSDSYTVTKANGEPIGKLAGSDELFEHTYNRENIEPYITFHNIDGYEYIYRRMFIDYPPHFMQKQLPSWEEVEKRVKRRFKMRYFGVFKSKYDLVDIQFNSPEYLQGFISAAEWLGEDYQKYILYIFDGRTQVTIV